MSAEREPSSASILIPRNSSTVEISVPPSAWEGCERRPPSQDLHALPGGVHPLDYNQPPPPAGQPGEGPHYPGAARRSWNRRSTQPHTRTRTCAPPMSAPPLTAPTPPTGRSAAQVISKNRMQIGGAMDGVLALGRIEMEKQGEGSCSDPEGECRDSARGYSNEE